MQLTGSVQFLHPVTNIAAAYLQSSIMILSSRTEGFGNVLNEARACGLPCVAFDCPSGPADIIHNGEDGFLIENGNIDQMAERIIQLIENPELRKAMGRQAKENARHYLPENIVPQWDRLFKQLTKTP